jgi:hypothetical protein
VSEAKGPAFVYQQVAENAGELTATSVCLVGAFATASSSTRHNGAIRWAHTPRKGGSTVETDELLSDLRTSQTDLARFVEAVRRNSTPYVVVSTEAVRAWQRREPQAWEKVTGWLAANHVAVVAV